MKILFAVCRSLWRGLDETRRALLNLLLLAVLLGIAWSLLRPGPPALKDNTTLVLRLEGNLVEQYSGSMRDRAAVLARGGSLPRQVRLRDVLLAVDEAARDPKITRMLLDVDDLGGAGMASLREVASALQRFKAAGKPVIAWAEGYSQGQYFLAAHANEVYLHPMGQVAIEGFGRHRIYYKDLFDRLGVQAHVMRAGRYKNYAEAYVASSPSPETMEVDRSIYGGLWSLYADGVEKARKQPAGSLAAGIEQLPRLLDEARGSVAQLALNAHLVDGLKTRDDLQLHLLASGAAPQDDARPSAHPTPAVRSVALGEYLSHVKPRTRGDAVAVVVAEGTIVDGDAAPGSVGGRSTAALIRRAREDDKVKALVLRVRSPGGSAFASELVRHELALLRKAGKPVVVSMGDVAASGGYWISTAADEVIADAATLTGSIGVIAMLPSAEGAMARLGLRTGGVTTTWLGDGYDWRRGLEPRFAKLIQTNIDHTYADFLAKVATARKSTPEKIDAVAQGRVWTGAQAHERGLVDRLGSWGDALKSARQRAKLSDDSAVVYLERGGGRLESLANWFLGAAADLGLDASAGGAGADWMRTLSMPPELDALRELVQASRDSSGQGLSIPPALAHCGCTAVP